MQVDKSATEPEEPVEDEIPPVPEWLRRLVGVIGAVVFGRMAFKAWYNVLSSPGPVDAWMIAFFPILLLFLAMICGVTLLALWFAWQAIRPNDK